MEKADHTESRNTFKKIHRAKGTEQNTIRFVNTQTIFCSKRKKHKPDKNYGPEPSDPIDIDELQLRIWCEEWLAEFIKFIILLHVHYILA